MSRRAFVPVFLRFLMAVVLTALVGTVIQTQINLAALQAIGVGIPIGVRASTTLDDLLRFSPTLAALACVALAVALPIAGIVQNRFPAQRTFIFIFAGWTSVLVAFWAANAFAPMPTLIAATRTLGGAIAVAASGALGAWFFASRRVSEPKKAVQYVR